MRSDQLLINEQIKDAINAVLNRIITEIADLDDAEYEFEGYYKAVNDAVQIIDKYREEQICGNTQVMK